MLEGSATPDATAAFAARRVKDSGAASGHFRTARGLTVGTVGLGSYLGEPDDATDAAYEAAVEEFVRLGGNVIDTAINYRAQRSERSIGRALGRCVSSGLARREELVLCTKAGYLSFDGHFPSNAKELTAWIDRTFYKNGVMRPDDIVEGCHVMTPGYLRHQLSQSQRNLDCDSIDVFYLHNPETQLKEVERPAFLKRIRAAFEALEEMAAARTIGAYGLATWNGFRVAPTTEEYLSLEELVGVARSLAGDSHHFRFLQAPFNLAMLEAARFANQRVGHQLVPLFEAATRLEIACVASATILQGKLSSELPDAIAAVFPGLASDAMRAIQFNRSTPSVAATLVGMSSTAHVVENMGLVKRPPAPGETVKKLLLRLA